MSWGLRSFSDRRRDGASRSTGASSTRTSGKPDPLEGLEGSVLVLLADDVARRHLPYDPAKRGATVVRLGVAGPDVSSGWDAVLLVGSDRAVLRREVPAIPQAGAAKQFRVWLTGTRTPLALTPRPEWPLVELEARRAERPLKGVMTTVRLGRKVKVQTFFAEAGIQSAPSRDRSYSSLFTGYVEHPPLPGLDAGARPFAAPEDTVHPDLVVPLDVLVTTPGRVAAAEGAGLHPHHVTERAPVLVTPTGLDPVDECVFNPVRWEKNPEHPVVDLSELAGRAGVTESLVARARAHAGVRVDLATTAPADVLRLAMAGIPLVAGDAAATRTAGLERGYASTVVDELVRGGDLDDVLDREEYALRLRRATFDAHSTLANRAGLAARAGVERFRSRTGGLPGVSVLLATKREHEVENAVRNVAKQVGVDVELVVAAHGFTPDRDKVAAILAAERPAGESEVGLVVLPFDSATFFGDVLSGAAQAASYGVLMKMDDDDWYSPHALHDLLMARRFSGADLVGMPTEFVHLKTFDQTVHGFGRSEHFTDHVAGGTMTISRDLLRELGWFRPVRRWVDAQLLAMVHAVGGTTYRTHGLGYVLVRGDEGHTWEWDPENFRKEGTVERDWAGFRPPGGEL